MKIIMLQIFWDDDSDDSEITEFILIFFILFQHDGYTKPILV